MKIKRTIHGEEFEIELTQDEMMTAAWQMEEDWAYEDILDRFDWISDEFARKAARYYAQKSNLNTDYWTNIDYAVDAVTKW